MQQGGSVTRLGRLSGGATRWAVYLLFFLLPLFFLPWTTNALETNKQVLLVVLTSVALLAWLGGMVANKRLLVRGGWLNLCPLLFLIGVFVSSLFSIAGYRTWVGAAGQEYTGFLTFAVFALLFYVLAHAAGETRVQRGALLGLLSSAALLGIVSAADILTPFSLPFGFAQGVGFNTVGTLNMLTVFLTAAMFVGFAMWLVADDGTDNILPSGKTGLLLRAAIIAVTATNLYLMILVDFWLLWVLNIVGTLVLTGFVFIRSKGFPRPGRFILPFLVLIISILLLFFSSPLRANTPVVVSPSYGLSWDISRSVLSENVPRLLWGSGPGTFAYDYGQHRPVEVNQTPFWNTRFEQSKSFLLTLLTTTGAVGAAFWLGFVLYLAAKSFSRLVRERDSEEWKMTYVLFAGWSVMLVSHLLYTTNMTLHFLFWGLSGLLASQVIGALRSLNFDRSPRAGLLASFAFVLVAVGTLLALFVSGQRYAAEAAFARAVQLDRQEAELTEVAGEISRAASLNPLTDTYQRNLSSAILLRAGEIIDGRPASELSEDELGQLQQLVAAAVRSANRATRIEPHNVVNWTARGAIYRDVTPFVSNAEPFALATFERAAELEPNNPMHHTNIGRSHLIIAERAARLAENLEEEEAKQQAEEQRSQSLADAETALTEATELKGDYAPAHYYLAIVFERQDRLEDAAVRLAALVNASPLDVGLRFQLSILLTRMERYDVAAAQFERILELEPEYENAMWFLASVYEAQGRTQDAIDMVAKVAELMPDNELVAQRLDRMRQGQDAPEDVPPPVEEGEQGATDAPQGLPEAEESQE